MFYRTFKIFYSYPSNFKFKFSHLSLLINFKVQHTAHAIESNINIFSALFSPCFASCAALLSCNQFYFIDSRLHFIFDFPPFFAYELFRKISSVLMMTHKYRKNRHSTYENILLQKRRILI